MTHAMNIHRTYKVGRGQGLLSAPLSALFFGGIIYAFSKNTGPDRTKASDHSEIVKQFDRSKILKK
jgi:hypothetical protein